VSVAALRENVQQCDIICVDYLVMKHPKKNNNFMAVSTLVFNARLSLIKGNFLGGVGGLVQNA